VYKISETGLFAKDFALRDQIRKAAISVMSNVAEGFERSSDKEFQRFLFIAKGSAGELRSQLFLAIDLHYITVMNLST
jgi:four helix bundle protein